MIIAKPINERNTLHTKTFCELHMFLHSNCFFCFYIIALTPAQHQTTQGTKSMTDSPLVFPGHSTVSTATMGSSFKANTSTMKSQTPLLAVSCEYMGVHVERSNTERRVCRTKFGIVIYIKTTGSISLLMASCHGGDHQSSKSV